MPSRSIWVIYSLLKRLVVNMKEFLGVLVLSASKLLVLGWKPSLGARFAVPAL